ncbi:MAG TPA: PxKF domain-containing protein [Gemmatimonadales bacterium]
MPRGEMMLNSIKGGQSVPLKFEVFVGNTERTDVAAVKSFTQSQVTCPMEAATDAIEVTSTGGTVLRYDATAGQFIQNWQTPKTAGKCYRVTMTTLDDSSVYAYFKTK